MVYQVCRPRKNKEGGTPFTNWLRKQPGLESNTRVGFVNTDLDVVWYNYVKAKLMIIEQKLGGEEYTSSQRTTHSVLDQHLRFASRHPEFRLKTPPGCLPIPTRVDYCGLHVVRLEDASHDEENVWLGKGRIWIDDRQVSREKLYRFLKFEEAQSQVNSLKQLQSSLAQALEDISKALDRQATWEDKRDDEDDLLDWVDQMEGEQ